MYKALYRKWRPQTFDEVVGQGHVTDILKYQVANHKISHAYLFCGSRGTGKTTCAKILSRAVNCTSPVNGNPCNCCEACQSMLKGLATDVIEMDAASNNGVENVRDIREEVVYSPAALAHRVYIIDEVHMLSVSAFNALLKTLEEPPEHVIFILATTELQKLPTTIISRCQRYDFRRIGVTDISARLHQIADAEGMDLTPDGAHLIARMAQGGMRDAVSLLELCAGTGKQVNEALVADMLGTGGKDAIYQTVRAVAEKDYDAIYRCVADLVAESKDLTVFWQELIDLYRDMMVMKTCRTGAEYLDMTDAEEKTVTSLASLFSLETLLYHSRVLEDALYAMQRVGLTKRSTAELALTRLCEPRLSTDPTALLARIGKLEEETARLRLGVPADMPTPKPVAKEGREAPPSQPPAPPATRPTVPTESASADTEQADAEKFQPLAYWPEVVELLSAQKSSIAGFLTKTKAYHSAKKGFLLRTESDFIVNILKREDVLLALRCAMSEKAGHSIMQEPFDIVSLAGAGAGRTNKLLAELESRADTEE